MILAIALTFAAAAQDTTDVATTTDPVTQADIDLESLSQDDRDIIENVELEGPTFGVPDPTDQLMGQLYTVQDDAVIVIAVPWSGDLVGSLCPRTWALDASSAQLVSVSGYTQLFSLLGTTYGGDGRTTFGLPDTRGRTLVSTQKYSEALEGRSTERCVDLDLGALYGASTKSAYDIER
jgi:hypothetical protein